MKYPLEKYKFYRYKNEKGGMTIAAASTYGGKTVKGYAKCDPIDTFDIEKGKKLAAARCNLKIAEKRRARAAQRFSEANRMVGEAKCFQRRMNRYLDDSENDVLFAQRELEALIKSM